MSAGDGDRAREVIVPDPLYRVITVFSTLIAIICVVGGFVLLDLATDRASATLGQINVPLALIAILIIVIGAGQYAFASRFRAEGMETDNNTENKSNDNG
ncbi:MAG: hypothetical protein ABEI52_12820 [Halobacteriaceae archaeon]